MTILELKTDINHSLSLLSNDEESLEKVSDFLKNLVYSNKHVDDSYIPRTKKELEDDFVEAVEDLKRYKKGEVEFRAAEELIDEL